MSHLIRQKGYIELAAMNGCGRMSARIMIRVGFLTDDVDDVGLYGNLRNFKVDNFEEEKR